MSRDRLFYTLGYRMFFSPDRTVGGVHVAKKKEIEPAQIRHFQKAKEKDEVDMSL